MAKKREEEPVKTDGWKDTFSDLMNLLLCFFVLLFASSSVDVEKFQQIAQSFANSFSILNGGQTGIGEGVLIASGASQLTELSEYYTELGKNEEGEEEDPRAELVQQLLEYKMYKYMSNELRDRMNQAARTFYKKESIPEEVLAFKQPVDTDGLLDGLTLDRLHEIYKSILRRQEDKIDPIRSKFGKIEKEDISLPEKLEYVQNYAREHKKFSFRSLLEKQPGKSQIIVTFLAILELMKAGVIRICQEHIFDDIQIESV